ncbi:MAG: FAD-dependent oxidoreductase, partial [Anaerolineales bacterium]|nr:FAD-dependent oxidoreductase [Anaerolineales bacterium]
MERYVIIGSGAAGIAAAESIRRTDPEGEIVLLSAEKSGYYSRPGLAYYLTGELNEKQLFPFSAQDFNALGVHPQIAHVKKILPEQHLVELQDGGYLGYDRLLVATGACAARVNIPGADLKGVVKLDNLIDAQQIMDQARRRRTAVVVGGGITALEIVEGLVSRGVKTHYFLRGDRYWHNVLDEIESRIVEGRLKDHGVKIHYHTELDEILARNGNVGGVRMKDGGTLRCDIVAIAIGIRPRVKLARECGLEIERGILVDEYLQTSAADVFAAGDAAQVYDPFTGKYVIDSLWGPAREQGSIAGRNMAGGREIYSKTVAFNVTRLAGLTTTIIGTVGKGKDDDLVGIARGDSETWRQLPDAIIAQQDFEINRLRLMLGEKTILGAIVMGDQTLSKPLHTLVSDRVDISLIKSRLLEPRAPVADLIA